jgi:spore coat protein CotF
MSNEHIDPYKLLGVTYESSITEVRKAFFELALICHPDKGGNPDDMRMLQCAYDWIANNLKVVKEMQSEHDWIDFLKHTSDTEHVTRSITDVERSALGLDDAFMESLFMENAEFIREQSRCKNIDDQFVKASLKQTVLNMIHMYAVALAEHMKPEQVVKSWYQNNLKTFFSHCHEVARASILLGYESMMDVDPDHEDASKPLQHDFGKKDIIVHHEPSHAPEHKSIPILASSSLVLPTNMDDFTTTNLCDYRQAFMDASDTLNDLINEVTAVENLPFTDALEAMKTVRSMDDMSISSRPVKVDLSFKNQTQ